MPRNLILTKPRDTWDAVLAHERLWSASGYRALARIKDHRPARLAWVIDAIEAGVGTSFAAALRDARMHPGGVSAMFLTAAIDQGIIELKPDAAAPTEAYDRGFTAIGREQQFNFHQLLAGFTPVNIAPADWQLFRECLERFQLGDLSHPVNLRSLLERLNFDVEQCVYSGRPVEIRDHTELAYIENLCLNERMGDLVITVCGLLFLPEGTRDGPLSDLVEHSGLEALAQKPGSCWVAWDAIDDYQASYPPGIVTLLISQSRESREPPQRKYLMRTTTGEEHKLEWTARTLSSGGGSTLLSQGIRWGYVLK